MGMKYLGQWQGWLAPSRLVIRESGPILTAILASLPEKYRQNSEQTLAELTVKISAGQIADANGKAYTSADNLQAGQEIFIFRAPIDQDQEVAELAVLWRGKAAMIVDKPAGIATIPRGKYIARSVVYQARKQFNNPKIVAAHRLDKLTSGCLLLVTDTHYRSHYQLLFEKRQVRKRYLACTEISESSRFQVGQHYCWRLMMRKKPNSLQVEVVDWEKGNSARERKDQNHGLEKELRSGERLGETSLNTFAALPQNLEVRWHYTETRAWLRAEKNGYWQWELEPYTGFTHQLRAALSYQGLPIIGDPLYPQVSEIMAEDSAKSQLSLCAWQLSFIDPLENLVVQAESSFKF